MSDSNGTPKPKVRRDGGVWLDGRLLGWVGHTSGSYRGNILWKATRRGLYGRPAKAGGGIFNTRADAVAALVADAEKRAS